MNAMKMCRVAVIAVCCLAAPAWAATFYISPGGSDWSRGTEASRPVKTFARAFGLMSGGDTLVLLDGVYAQAAGTGGITYVGSASAQPPSGPSPQQPTRIVAQTPGKAVLRDPLFLGRRTRKDSNIEIRGLTVLAQGVLYNTSHVTIKDCGFGDSFAIGTNDHDQGNTDNLVEDVWVWAAGRRIIAINYRSHRNVWRRVLVRGDGCGTQECTGSGNPNVGFTVYDSHDVSVQNVMVVDRELAPSDSPYSDIAIASHTGAPYTFGRNEWLGTLSLNAPDIGYYMEPDVGTIEVPTIHIRDAVAWNARAGGFNLARAGVGNVVENITAYTRGGDAVRVAPELGPEGVLRNVLVLGAGRYGINSAYPATHVMVHGQWREGAFNQTRPREAVEGNPAADGSLKYPVRIEPGSRLKARGTGGSDIGANLLWRYGKDGTHYGEAGYNGLSNVPLWPWPNEDRIKAEMCTEVQRGFCSSRPRADGKGPTTLTSYIWESLGHPLPERLTP